MSKHRKWYDQPVNTYTKPVTSMFSHDGVKPRANYMLTAKGKIKVEEVNISGPKGEVMMALDNSESPSTISELSRTTGLLPQKVKQVVHSLVRDGWVTKTSAE